MTNSKDYPLPSKVAIVHEWFSSKAIGGAEQVVKQLDNILKPIPKPKPV